jgi:hypothetical protein
MAKHENAIMLLSLGLIMVLVQTPGYSRQESKPSYESLLELVKKGDPAADFKALRLAYADNPPKDAGGTDPDVSRSMFSAMREKNYAKAIESAEKIMKSEFVDINAHLVASSAYKEKGNGEKEKFHRYVAEGLIKSILNSGDGKSQDTAFTVISTGEEYVILRVYGLMPGSQSLESSKGHHYDRLDAIDPKTKEKVTLYFNIDRPFGALENLFKK